MVGNYIIWVMVGVGLQGSTESKSEDWLMEGSLPGSVLIIGWGP